MKFGRILRRLRKESEIGIKGLAPRLGVSYSYLSKFWKMMRWDSSEELVGRIAKYFRYDRDRLLLSAGKVFLQMCWRF